MTVFDKFIIPYFGFILFFFAVLAYFMEANYKRNNRFFKYGYLLLLLGFLFFLFGENLFAKWWIIDDHEIFKFIGDYKTQIGFGDYWDIALNKTEIGAFGNYPRYRPSYFLLRILELVLWKDNPFLWYSFRLLVLFTFTVSIYFLISKYASYTTSFLFVLWVFSYTYWGDIFSSMGPAEI